MTLATVTREREDGVPVALLDGDVDAANAADVCAQVLQAVGNRDAGLVLDVTGVRYLDSAGVNVLFDVHDQLRMRRQALHLIVDEQAPLHRVLSVSGVLTTIPAHPRRDAALAGVSTPA